MTDTPENQVRRWLQEVVIGYRFCPFAKRALDSGAVHFSVCTSGKTAQMLEALATELQQLDADPERETTLLILTESLRRFDTYLDFLALAQSLLEDLGYEGVYQLASFHPEYQFADSDYDDPANYTNRSPWPIIHVLREASVAAAIDSYPDVDVIPQRNIGLARQQGERYWRRLLETLRGG